MSGISFNSSNIEVYFYDKHMRDSIYNALGLVYSLNNNKGGKQ